MGVKTNIMYEVLLTSITLTQREIVSLKLESKFRINSV